MRHNADQNFQRLYLQILFFKKAGWFSKLSLPDNWCRKLFYSPASSQLLTKNLIKNRVLSQ